MVVGEIRRHSGSAEASRGMDIGHTRIEDLEDKQEAQLERKKNEWKLEEGTIVVSEQREKGRHVTSLIFKPSELREDGASKPWVVVLADDITKGEVRVRALVQNLGVLDENPFVPVASEDQIVYARSFNANILDVINSAGEGLLAVTTKVQQGTELLAA